MDEEHDAHEDDARQVIRSLVPAWRDQPLDAMQWLTGGYTNRNWRFAVEGHDYAVRVVRNLGPRPVEATYLALPSAPAVVAFDKTRGHLITEWIDAPTLAQAPASAEETGIGIARLHGEIPAGIQRYDVKAVVTAYFRAARDAGCLDRRAAAAFQRLSWHPTRIKGCHNDLNPWNVLCTPRGWRTLDWEHAGDNDPLFDVLGLCTCLEWEQDATWLCVQAWSEAAGTPHPPPSTSIERAQPSTSANTPGPLHNSPKATTARKSTSKPPTTSPAYSQVIPCRCQGMRPSANIRRKAGRGEPLHWIPSPHFLTNRRCEGDEVSLWQRGPRVPGGTSAQASASSSAIEDW